MRRPKTHVLALSVLPLLLCAASGCTLATLLRQRERGGVYIVLAVRADSAQLYQSVEQTMAVMRSRCDGLAVVCNVERQGGEWSNRIMLRVSGATDTARLKRVLLAEGRLEFRPVVSPPSPVPVQTYTTREKAAAAAGKDNDVLPYTNPSAAAEQFVVVERTPIVTGQDVRSARAAPSFVSESEYQIDFQLKPEGAQRFAAWTGANLNRYLAVAFNGRAVTVAFIKSQISDTGQINGHFNKQEAEDTALVLVSGNLPAPVELVEEGAYKP